MNNPLFDMSPYQTRSTCSYSPDWRDATGSDPAWDEPDVENSTAELLEDSQDNSTIESAMEEETDLPLHAEVEVVEQLSPEEEIDRQRLELKVERGLKQVEQTFYAIGVALRELRERRLYRSTHRNFGDYCRERFRHIKRRQAEYLILASEVVDDLRTAHNCAQFPLPSSESQVRAMKNLNTEQRIEVWQTGVAESSGKIPTAKTIKGIVDRLKEKPIPQLSLTYKRGDTFILQGLSGAERRYNGCWAIAREVLEFSLKVETHDAMLLVKPDNLDPIDDLAVCRELMALLKRIGRLRKCELDRGAIGVLELLGKQTYLTEVEEKLLKLLENHYGTD